MSGRRGSVISPKPASPPSRRGSLHEALAGPAGAALHLLRRRRSSFGDAIADGASPQSIGRGARGAHNGLAAGSNHTGDTGDPSAIDAIAENDITKCYSSDDLAVTRELYDALLACGALARGDWAPDHLPTAFELLGTADTPHLKIGLLRALIKKHGVGVNKDKRGVLSFAELVRMVCVPSRDKPEARHRNGRRMQSGQLAQSNNNNNSGSSAAQQQNQQLLLLGGGTGVGDGASFGGGDGKGGNSDGTLTFDSSMSKLLGAFEHAEESRPSSPDLFGDIRSSSPTSPTLEIVDEVAPESSPERVLAKLERVVAAQCERTKRAKRVMRLGRKDLYAACDIIPVSTFAAGYDPRFMARNGQKYRHDSPASGGGSQSPRSLMADEESRAETARYIKQMATPRGVQGAPYHGAAARSIGAPQPQPLLMSSAAAPHSARSVVSAAPSMMSRVPGMPHPPPPSKPAAPKEKEVWTLDGKQSFRRPRPTSARPMSRMSVLSETTLDEDDSTSHGGTTTNIAQDESHRCNMRSGRLHVRIDDPKKTKSRPVVSNLSVRVALREAQRRLEESNDVGSHATSRTLARRLRKIDAGDKVHMFDDVESKLLSQWLL